MRIVSDLETGQTVTDHQTAITILYEECRQL